MKKKAKTLSVILLVFALLLSLFPVAASADEGTVTISSAEEWNSFAEKCRLDSYSQGLSVELTNDITLNNTKDPLVPIFCGSFNGNGHTISGFFADVQTDTIGLFRILGEEASIRDLTVMAYLKTSGERKETGILCGKNNGIIENCRTYGILEGYELAGGIAGINYGTISSCTSDTKISVSFLGGGITGENSGTIENCTNHGEINLEANENATNIGGITGRNQSVLTGCINTGKIGYLHTGYNIGGIAGISKGFLSGCSNSGEIAGRRDCGGIAGQMEPCFRMEYGENAMDLLDNSITGFSGQLSAASAAIQNAINNGATGLSYTLGLVNSFSQDLSGQVSSLFSGMSWIETAKGYIAEIRNTILYIKDNLPGGASSRSREIIEQIEAILDQFDTSDTSTWPTIMEQLMDYLTQLSFSLDDFAWISESFSGLSENFRNLASIVTTGFQDFGANSTYVLEDASARLSEIVQSANDFLSQATEDVGFARSSIEEALSSLGVLQGSVQNVLDGKIDTEEDISAQITNQDLGMITSCQNSGMISSDYSSGGIIGNLSKELSIDQEEDPAVSPGDLLFADTTLFIRATVYDCKNSGDCKVKYDYAGGILGYGSRGGIISCENSGNSTSGKDYSGGICGLYRGTVQSCCSIGKVSALSYAGGIAGDGKEINQCISIPEIDSEGAFLGSVAGTLEEGSGNLFVNDSIGGANGISYSEIAEPVSYEALLSLDGIPESMRTLSIRFIVDGEEIEETKIPYGGSVTSLPSVKPVDGKYWCWDEFEKDGIRYSQTVQGEWKNYITTIGSGEFVPTFLVEGEFDDSAGLSAKELSALEDIFTMEEDFVPSAYTLSLTGSKNYAGTDHLTVRFRTEMDGDLYKADPAAYTLAGSLSYQRDGEYIVFELEDGGSFIFIPKEKKRIPYLPFLIAGGVVVLAAVIVLILILRKRKKNRTGEPSPEKKDPNKNQPKTKERSTPEKSGQNTNKKTGAVPENTGTDTELKPKPQSKNRVRRDL